MQRVLNALSRNPLPSVDPLLYIVVAQYQRYNYGIGEENRFHWAIAIIEDLENSAKEQCRCYQVSNRIVKDPVPHVEWVILVNRLAVLGNTGKYRGVGRVKKSELKELDTVRQMITPWARLSLANDDNIDIDA